MQSACQAAPKLSAFCEPNSLDSSHCVQCVYDGNGNITDYVGTNGISVAHYEYGPFGEIETSSGSKADNFTHRFSTKPLDANTGLVRYALRDYSAVLGRWISKDSIAETGGANLYNFSGNAPSFAIDLLGLTAETFIRFYMPDKKSGGDLVDMEGKPAPDADNFYIAEETLIRGIIPKPTVRGSWQDHGGLFYLTAQVILDHPNPPPLGSKQGVLGAKCIQVWIIPRIKIASTQKTVAEVKALAGTVQFWREPHRESTADDEKGGFAALLNGKADQSLMPKEVVVAHELGHASPMFKQTTLDAFRKELYVKFQQYENKTFSAITGEGIWDISKEIAEAARVIWANEYRIDGNKSANEATFKLLTKEFGQPTNFSPPHSIDIDGVPGNYSTMWEFKGQGK